MEPKRIKKLVLKKEVIQELNDDEMNHAFGGCSPVYTKVYSNCESGYSPCQETPTYYCTPG